MIRRVAVSAVAVSAFLALGTATAAAQPHPPVAHPIDATTDWNNAVGVMANNLAVATAAGSVGGAVAGLAGGCLLGAATGAALTPPIFLPGAAGGCIAGAAAGAGLGTAIGTIVAVVPVGVGSVVQEYQVLHAAGDVAAPMR